MKSIKTANRGFRWGVAALLLGFFCIGTLAPRLGNTETPAPKKNLEKKTGGMMGDPAGKRGVEYGFDKGFAAGKKDKDAGLEPDPKRHEDFNDPEKFYRYEFGARSSFVNGFRSGFVGGYQKAFGKKGKVIVPGVSPPSSGEASADSPITKPIPASTGSDAL
jgi:hypothetical protein